MIVRIEEPLSSGTFIAIGGQRDLDLDQSNDLQDVSSKDTTAGFTAWDGAVGIKDMPITFGGILDDSNAGQAALQTAFENREKRNFEVTDGKGDRFTGEFYVRNLSLTGPHVGPGQYRATIQNAGDLTREPDI